MQYPELPLFAFLFAVLVLVPLPWHWRDCNVATLAIIFWLFFTNIIHGVNSIVWAGNVRDSIPVWCDITTKFVIGASYALPLATLCICKHLEMVSSSRKLSYDAKDRQRRMIFEAFMCFVVPAVFMALHYIVQGHRYDIFEDVGCQAAVFVSVPAIVIIWFPQLLFYFVAFIFAILALHHFIRRRLTFAFHLQNSNSGLTTNRYLRLIAMAMTLMVWGTMLTVYNLGSKVSSGLRPWTNWADVHSDRAHVDLFATADMPTELIRTTMLFWWTLPVSSIIFFVFFGFGEEAVKEYKKMWILFKTKVLRRSSESGKKGGSLSSSRTLRPLKLSNLKATNSTSSSSTTFSPCSSASRLSQSTVTLATYSPEGYNTHMKSKSGEAKEDGLPSYYASPYTASSSNHHPQMSLSMPIDPNRRSTTTVGQLDLPEIDNSDTFTMSRFSYYESSPASPYTNAAPTSAGSTSTLEPDRHMHAAPNPYSPPPQPPISPRLPTLQHSLPPPPRRGPRTAGSLSSLLRTAAGTSSAPQHVVYDVPEDVGPASYTQPANVLDALPERTLGVKGGRVFITVQRQASVDQFP